MEYSLEEAEDAVTVNVKGSFTFHDYKQWREVIENLFATDTSRHIVDLTGLENIDSAGLGMLLYMKDQSGKHGTEMYLRHSGSGLVKTMLDQAQVEKLIPFCDG